MMNSHLVADHPQKLRLGNNLACQCLIIFGTITNRGHGDLIDYKSRKGGGAVGCCRQNPSSAEVRVS